MYAGNLDTPECYVAQSLRDGTLLELATVARYAQYVEDKILSYFPDARSLCDVSRKTGINVRHLKSDMRNYGVEETFEALRFGMSVSQLRVRFSTKDGYLTISVLEPDKGKREYLRNLMSTGIVSKQEVQERYDSGTLEELYATMGEDPATYTIIGEELTVSQIANKYGLSKRSVYKIIQERGISELEETIIRDIKQHTIIRNDVGKRVEMFDGKLRTAEEISKITGIWEHKILMCYSRDKTTAEAVIKSRIGNPNYMKPKKYRVEVF